MGNTMNEVFQRLADEADDVVRDINKNKGRMDISIPNYAALQNTKLEA